MTRVKLTNAVDLGEFRHGLLHAGRVRSVEIDALVDTGATMLVLPADVVEALDLPVLGRRRVRYANGAIGEVPVVSDIRIEILGREMTCDALVEAVGTTPLVGQIPLEGLDLIVDPKSREARVNPASPDSPLLDILSAA